MYGLASEAATQLKLQISTILRVYQALFLPSHTTHHALKLLVAITMLRSLDFMTWALLFTKSRCIMIYMQHVVIEFISHIHVGIQTHKSLGIFGQGICYFKTNIIPLLTAWPEPNVAQHSSSCCYSQRKYHAK